MQHDDGLWATYFYPSPYYSTRLFCELLSALGGEHLVALRRTLDGLLHRDVPTSAAQAAEMMIALQCLEARFPERLDEIRARVSGLATRLQRAQLEDGSWEGEVIWRFAHRVHREPVIGLDCHRVHSTSLALRALDAWQESGTTA
jgi:hypothetical protein